MKLKSPVSLALFFSLLVSGIAFSQESEEFLSADSQIQVVPVIKLSASPEIPKLEARDFLYKQYSEDLKQFYLDLAHNKPLTITFYSYQPQKQDTIFTIAARCNIPYDTIASVNQLTAADTDLTSKKLLLPAASGVFVLTSDKPQTSLEALLQKNYNDKLNENAYLCYNIDGRSFKHLPQERLDQTTRAFFLDVKMKTPLDRYWLSSDYGYRPSPFGGQKQFHRGIDMAAPEGTQVYACKAGTVSSVVKMDRVFGNYIVIKHVNGLSSIYAHLSKIQVKTGEMVTTGQEIGQVGTTGQVTGPHLHFEIRQNGQPTDPGAYLKR